MSGEEPTPARPAKSKKKRRAPSGSGEAPLRAKRDKAAPELETDDAASVEPEVPEFARKFPRDAELDRLVAEFEAGNYAGVRELAPALAKKTESDEVRKAARELVRRTEPDPLAVYMLCAAIALLAFLSYWYWSHPHPAP